MDGSALPCAQKKSLTHSRRLYQLMLAFSIFPFAKLVLLLEEGGWGGDTPQINLKQTDVK